MRTHFFTLAALFIITNIQLPAETPSLWQKAVTLQSENLNLTPGAMTMTFELLDKKGRPDMVDVTTYKFSPGENGEPESELVSAFHDGEDVTEKRKAEEEKAKAKAKNSDKKDDNSVGFSLEDSPLHPDNQSKIKVTALNQPKTIDGRECTAFSYELPLDESTKMGTIWVDSKNGVPVLHEFTTNPLPPKMKEIKNRVKFTLTEDNKFYISDMMFEGVGGILIIKKSFRGTMTFSDYWEMKN